MEKKIVQRQKKTFLFTHHLLGKQWIMENNNSFCGHVKNADIDSKSHELKCNFLP